jgi:hypothetical protein
MLRIANLKNGKMRDEEQERLYRKAVEEEDQLYHSRYYSG